MDLGTWRHVDGLAKVRFVESEQREALVVRAEEDDGDYRKRRRGELSTRAECRIAHCTDLRQGGGAVASLVGTHDCGWMMWAVPGGTLDEKQVVSQRECS